MLVLVVLVVINAAACSCIPAGYLIYSANVLSMILIDLVNVSAGNAQVTDIRSMYLDAATELAELRRRALRIGSADPAMLAALDADERILRSYLDVDRYRATVLGFVVTYGVVRTILVTLLTIMGRLVVIGDHHDGIASQRGPASASQEPHNACRPSRRSGGAFLRHRGSRGAGGRSRKWSLKRGPRSLQALLRRVPGDRALRVRLPRRPRWKRRLRGLPEGPRRPPISPLLLRHMSPPRERKLRKRP